MRAAVFTGTQRVETRDIPTPTPGRGEVAIEVLGCGVCGTDSHIFLGELRAAKPPVVLGHEIVGTVVEMGPEVEGFSVGRTVAVDPVVACGKCEFCHAGRSNLCSNTSVIGYVRNGGFSERTVVPATHLHPIDPAVGIKGGILTETLACVINGYDRLNPQAGCSALILGAGTVGLLWNQMLLRTPVTALLQSEPVAMRRDRARELGAQVVIDPVSDSLREAVLDRFPDGVDIIVDASGEAPAVEEAMPLVRKGGTFLIFGVCAENAEIRISPFQIYEKEMKIIASKMPPRTLDRSARLLEAGVIDYERIVTDVMPIEKTAEAFERFCSGRDQSIKMAISPTV
jgi:2-desacetyl-2-hydroxyethyl bacteriochlorophyllide A dehydrogenase